MNRTSTILTITGFTFLSGVVAYAVYFDYKRRNDAAFRKKLRKDKKKVDKHVAQNAAASQEAAAVTDAEVRAALEKVRSETVPASPQEKEGYFMTQVNLGEQLCGQGPECFLPAAMCFYRALRVYPSPVELLMIYEKTMPDPVFKLVMLMTNMDVKNRVEGYYDEFPPKHMNVSVKPIDVPDDSGGTIRKRILVVTKDIQAGELIYKEQPVVAVLDADLEGKGSYCSYCLRKIEDDIVYRMDDDLHGSAFCSTECRSKSKTEYQNILFGPEPPLPAELAATELPAELTAARREAQAEFSKFVKAQDKSNPMLVAKFIARQISEETLKMLPGGGMATPPSDYSLYDHLERLRYLEVEAPEQETKSLRDVFQTALPGLEAFITDERHAMLKGKMAYNVYGVVYNGGRDDKPEPVDRPEDVEKTRTPFGTQRQIGSGLYSVSAYVCHSCEPSAEPSFKNGNSELHLIATRDLKAGDEVTVSFVDASVHEGESVSDARRRRRFELARGWRFPCICVRCLREGNPADASDEAKIKDESKVEEAMQKMDEKDMGIADP